ncbi:hypothetical protein M011DRAFT_235517 [Sporormia fimetaria CBS 119925]|uniref:Subtelomeric hrmA-associated cluster protein AFUB-079030/YDR124W-like helical bundle domain-containing protein n=1 Tax=Sporormia fimetaria CBS 119925 TaxID=1340428 RepID=A0A6A6VM77_9PLEO|nr:hypothetical protein M011DRAFT_235517 [Sporormia fimetaria CBS 119925]
MARGLFNDPQSQRKGTGKDDVFFDYERAQLMDQDDAVPQDLVRDPEDEEVTGIPIALYNGRDQSWDRRLTSIAGHEHLASSIEECETHFTLKSVLESRKASEKSGIKPSTANLSAANIAPSPTKEDAHELAAPIVQRKDTAVNPSPDGQNGKKRKAPIVRMHVPRPRLNPERVESFRIGDEEQLKKYLTYCLSQLGANTLKIVIREWVSLVEPRRARTYGHYQKHGTDQPSPKRPWWWPADIRYKEPSHLRKGDSELSKLAIAIMLLHRHPDPQDGKKRINWTKTLRDKATRVVDYTLVTKLSSSRKGEYNNAIKEQVLDDILPELMDVAQEYEDYVAQLAEGDHVGEKGKDLGKQWSCREFPKLPRLPASPSDHTSHPYKRRKRTKKAATTSPGEPSKEAESVADMTAPFSDEPDTLAVDQDHTAAEVSAMQEVEQEARTQEPETHAEVQVGAPVAALTDFEVSECDIKREPECEELMTSTENPELASQIDTDMMLSMFPSPPEHKPTLDYGDIVCPPSPTEPGTPNPLLGSFSDMSVDMSVSSSFQSMSTGMSTPASFASVRCTNCNHTQPTGFVQPMATYNGLSTNPTIFSLPAAEPLLSLQDSPMLDVSGGMTDMSHHLGSPFAALGVSGLPAMGVQLPSHPTFDVLNPSSCFRDNVVPQALSYSAYTTAPLPRLGCMDLFSPSEASMTPRYFQHHH